MDLNTGNIQLKLGYKPSLLEIPYHFIDHYMAGCPPVYPLIYIYTLRHLMDGTPISVQGLSEHFNLTSTDITNAWRHWEKCGIIKMEGAGESLSIIFMPISAPASTPEMPKVPSPPTIKLTPTPPQEVRPQYTIEELSGYRIQSRDIEHLFTQAESALGKLLSYHDMNIVFGFYDWLRLPLNVIEYLFSYCAENNHRNLRYIEKCALDWAQNEIDDVDKAVIYVQAFDNNYRSILKQMGKLSFPTPAQRKQMDKWLNEMQLPLDVVLEACDRTTLSAEKPTLSYVDKILVKWHKNGTTTLDAIKTAEAQYNNEIETPKPKARKTRTNGFINFKQHEYDHAQIELMERQYMQQQLAGV